MDFDRRLAWHGMALFLIGLLMGIVVPAVTNPRMGLSAHVGTTLNGVFVLALAAVWHWVALAPRTASLAYWTTVAGSYLSSVALFLAGVFGTGRSTPLHGAGFEARAWQEAIVAVGLSLGALAILLGSGLLLWGLRRRSPEP